MAPKPKADVLQQKSPAEFFADNRTIAGFDNVRRRRPLLLPLPLLHPHSESPARAACRTRPCPAPQYTPPQPGKCLYTTIRELVENALDAAESISQLPDIDITVCVWGVWGVG